MFFSNTAYFIAFLSLIVPLLIHLWNKKEGKIIKIGSLRFLEASQSSRVKNIKINNILLLIIRCLFLSLLIFLIAEPFLNKPKESTPVKKILLVKNQEQTPYISALIDSLIIKGYAVKFSTINYEQYDKTKPLPIQETLQYLSQEFKDLEQILVLGTLQENDFPDLKNFRLPFDVNFISVPMQRSIYKLLNGLIMNDGLLRVSYASIDEEIKVFNDIHDFKEHITLRDDLALNMRQRGNEYFLYNSTDSLDYIKVMDPGNLDITIYAKPENRESLKVFLAALNAIENYLNISFENSGQQNTLPQKMQEPAGNKMTEDLDSSSNNATFFKEKVMISITDSLPKFDGGKKTFLLGKFDFKNHKALSKKLKSNLLSHILIEETDLYVIDKPLTVADNPQILNSTFVEDLMMALFNDAAFDEKISKNRVLSVDDLELYKPTVIEQNAKASVPDHATKSLSIYFWLLCLGLFGIERWYSQKVQNS
jgi:hypothetical protein